MKNKFKDALKKLEDTYEATTARTDSAYDVYASVKTAADRGYAHYKVVYKAANTDHQAALAALAACIAADDELTKGRKKHDQT